jgi:hypothetical protein
VCAHVLMSFALIPNFSNPESWRHLTSLGQLDMMQDMATESKTSSQNKAGGGFWRCTNLVREHLTDLTSRSVRRTFSQLPASSLLGHAVYTSESRHFSPLSHLHQKKVLSTQLPGEALLQKIAVSHFYGASALVKIKLTRKQKDASRRSYPPPASEGCRCQTNHTDSHPFLRG